MPDIKVLCILCMFRFALVILTPNDPTPSSPDRATANTGLKYGTSVKLPLRPETFPDDDYPGVIFTSSFSRPMTTTAPLSPRLT